MLILRYQAAGVQFRNMLPHFSSVLHVQSATLQWLLAEVEREGFCFPFCMLRIVDMSIIIHLSQLECHVLLLLFG